MLRRHDVRMAAAIPLHVPNLIVVEGVCCERIPSGKVCTLDKALPRHARRDATTSAHPWGARNGCKDSGPMTAREFVGQHTRVDAVPATLVQIVNH